MTELGPVESGGSPSTVALALLSVKQSTLYVAVRDGTTPCLPAKPVEQGRALDRIAEDQLSELVGASSGYIEQLYTFSFAAASAPSIVISYLALCPGAPSLSGDASWHPAADMLRLVSPADRTVLDYALLRLRAKIGYTTIAFHLMPKSFSLSDIQQTYETILGRPLDPRNFRRRLVSSGLLQPENRLRREGSHRPAALYSFAGNHDPASYLTPGAARRGRQTNGTARGEE
jgi:8-oxo-dGTP diphosphatase